MKHIRSSPTGISGAVDSIVENTMALLKSGHDVVNVAPIPGLTVAVDLLVMIFEKVQVRDSRCLTLCPLS